MQVSLIWAEDQAGWIGKDGQLPWHLSADLKHFKALTSGHPIVMGAATYHSLGDRPLPKRLNVVVTHQAVANPAVMAFDSLAGVKDWLATEPAEEVFIIGGANLFAQLAPLATRLYRTVVEGDHQGDVKMTAMNWDAFELVEKEPVQTEGEERFWFEEWQRRAEKR